MFCPECGKEVKAGAKFCSQCGTKLVGIQEENKFRQSQEKEQPTKAIVVEGIGLLLFVYLLIVNSTTNRDVNAQIFLEESGPGVFLAGLVFIVISYFMFRKNKKKSNLYGIGYGAYIISCIASILFVVILGMSVLTAIPVFFMG